ETPVKLGCDESHDELYARSVVPTAVEDHDFTCRGQMGHIPLEEHLGLFPVGWGREGHQSKDAGTHPLCDGADGAALASGVPPFEDHDDAQPLLLDPILKYAELALELKKLLFIGSALHLPVLIGVCHDIKVGSRALILFLPRHRH